MNCNLGIFYLLLVMIHSYAHVSTCLAAVFVCLLPGRAAHMMPCRHGATLDEVEHAFDLFTSELATPLCGKVEVSKEVYLPWP